MLGTTEFPFQLCQRAATSGLCGISRARGCADELPPGPERLRQCWLMHGRLTLAGCPRLVRTDDVLYNAKCNAVWILSTLELTMGKWTKRIRAAIAVGLTWGAAWFGAGMLLLLVVGLHAADVPFPLFFGLLGFLSGAAFSGVLGVLGRRRRFEEMSLPGFAAAGALGGLVVCGIITAAAGPGPGLLVGSTIFGLAGAVSAAGTLVLARRAEHSALVAPDDRSAARELDRGDQRR